MQICSGDLKSKCLLVESVSLHRQLASLICFSYSQSVMSYVSLLWGKA